ncbi:tellurite resistance TerB family protein [Bifidobacterium leontopitheci]|uniref:Tellurite resistance protein TerB n=1 Tax=Bifidobacterium leontopitheci TaxID=2650774 RepID=A0A6I1GI03_9BIFI|nr:TerB family tellurite resistance protein [Bifidobacterium leontopitheci]KAB7791304.1 tellurite resistance protein TerB [Bifidobacterium leontopitheci]
MTSIQRKGALKAFYYLMSVDGTVSDDELELFDHIGEELDGKHFRDYRQQVIDSCEDRLRSYPNEADRYDVIVEGVDEAVSHHAQNPENGVASRLLLWDMLATAFADGNYDDSERKLIRHIARTVIKDRSLYPEMEHLMRSAHSVKEELAWITSTDRPYSEVKPIVAQLEDRLAVIQRASTQLVADEMVPPIPAAVAPQQDVFDMAKDNVGRVTAPVVDQVQHVVQGATDSVKHAIDNTPVLNQAGNAMKSATDAVGNAVAPVGNELRKQAGNVAQEAKKQADNAANAVKGFVGGLFGGKR